MEGLGFLGPLPPDPPDDETSGRPRERSSFAAGGAAGGWVLDGAVSFEDGSGSESRGVEGFSSFPGGASTPDGSDDRSDDTITPPEAMSNEAIAISANHFRGEWEGLSGIDPQGVVAALIKPGNEHQW